MTLVATSRLATLALVGALAAGCTLGPNYTRPAVDVPTTYRDVAPPAEAPGSGSLADLQWFALFNDATLTSLVNTALAQNFDVRIAAERVEQARERFGIARADLFPTVNGAATTGRTRISEVGTVRLPQGIEPEFGSARLETNIRWELDVWGRLRRLSESARAQYLATEEARRGVLTTLVADVSQTYLTLRSLDLQLEIAQRTRDLARDGLRLTELRRDRGVATGVDVRQAEQLLYTATGQIANLERTIALTENALTLLLGQAPGDVPRGQPIEAMVMPPTVPAGIPSSLLERRPDVRQAEQQLISANAQIGAAKALYFPQISLTGFLGLESRELGDLLTTSAETWNIGLGAAAPLFNAGRTRANVRLTEAVQRELVVNYQRTIFGALNDVADALAGYRKTLEQRAEQERLVAALRDTARLATQRYQGGLDSYLPVLDAERNLFQSELTLAGLQRQALASIVELYRALGGGWEQQ